MKENKSGTEKKYVVNIFHIDTFYRFWHISCQNCFLGPKCAQKTRKRESCVVADDAEKNLIKFIRGHVVSFASNDFYVQTKNSRRDILPILNHLMKKYAKDRDVR